MVEQKLEKKAMEKIEAALEAAGISTIQVVGSLQPETDLKMVEKEDANGVVILKAAPRSYASPTIPTCEIAIGVNATIRADVDYNGMQYLDVASKIMDVLQHWQRCYDDTHNDFTVDGEFDCTGYQLDAGTFSFDRSDKVWQYSHQMTVFGVVLESAADATNNETNNEE